MSGPGLGRDRRRGDGDQAGDAARGEFANVVTYDMGGTSTDVGADPRRPCRRSRASSSSNTRCRSTCRWSTCTPSAPAAARSPRVDAGRHAAGRPAKAPAPRRGRSATAAAARGPTITDANLVLGRLDPDAAARVDRRRSTWRRCTRALLEQIGKPLGLDATAAAAAILRIANDKMAGAIRMVSLARGHDPRDFALFAFGGAGPLHAAALARELGIPKVLIPARPGLTNALGCVVADLRHDFVAPSTSRCRRSTEGRIAERLRGADRRAAASCSRARRSAVEAVDHAAPRRHAVPGPEPHPAGGARLDRRSRCRRAARSCSRRPTGSASASSCRKSGRCWSTCTPP